MYYNKIYYSFGSRNSPIPLVCIATCLIRYYTFGIRSFPIPLVSVAGEYVMFLYLIYMWVRGVYYTLNLATLLINFNVVTLG